MKCNNCNAALSADQIRGEDCPFCGIALQHAAEAIKSTAQIKELLRDADGDGVPDIFGKKERIEARVERLKAEGKPVHSARRLIAGVILFPLLIIGVGLVFDSNDPLKLGIRDLGFVRTSCVVQANGDETLDVAVFAPGWSYGGARIALFDGTDGSVLFKTDRLEGAAGLHCFDESAFLVHFSDGRQQIYQPSQPEEVFEFVGSDLVHSTGRWRDCVTVRTADRLVQSYSLSEGTISDCEVPNLTGLNEGSPNIMELSQDEVSWKRAAVRTKLTAASPGSPRLTVVYEGEDETHWEATLEFVKPTFTSAIETFPGRVMIWGAPFGKQGEPLLIALDDKTGELVYTVPFPQPSANSLNSFIWNGDFLLVGFGNGLWAIEPATGEVAWKRGLTGMGVSVN